MQSEYKEQKKKKDEDEKINNSDILSRKDKQPYSLTNSADDLQNKEEKER